MTKTFSFKDLNKEMKKNSLYGDTIDKSTISQIDHHIHTGNFNLNACLTGSLKGGYPNNRAVALAGSSGVGKTYLLLNGIREAQKQGYDIVFYDSENAVDKDLVEKFGIDSSRFRYEPCNTVQEFRSSITNLADTLIDQQNKGYKIPKILIALDSAGNLATQKEIDDAKTGSDKADMTRAKLLKSTFRILMTKLSLVKVPFIFTNHTYGSLDLFSKQIQGGGCLIPGSTIIMADDSNKKIEEIKEGDKIKTLIGDREISQTWNFNKNVIKVEFDNNTELIVSEDHRFYIGDYNIDIHDNKKWIKAKNIESGDYITSIKKDNIKQFFEELVKLKIKKVTKLKSTKVYDLSVDEAEHYITSNGVINHNSGPEYAASIILFLGKAKLKEGKEQTGIIVTARPNKNRFAKPIPIKFHISFSKGMNPYIGLEEYISWDVCGIERGNFITESQYEKLTEADQLKCRKHTYTETKTIKGKETEVENVSYFQPKATARNLCVAHLNDKVKLNKLYTPEVLTPEILDKLEPIVNEKFTYGVDDLTGDDLDSMLNTEEDDD